MNRRGAIAVIDEALCIGCLKCIDVCPVDAIVGARARIHTVVPELCSGCSLCVPPCPVDCVTMRPLEEGESGWSDADLAAADRRHDARLLRIQAQRTSRPQAENLPPKSERRAVIEAALERAAARRAARGTRPR